ncbi:MAG: DUF3604 domain-containing protein [Pseudomonadota bacterium]
MKTINTIVDRSLVGAGTPSVRPGDDPALYGSMTMTPARPVEARSFHTETLTYTVGSLGLDDSGAIRIAWRMVSDSGQPQWTMPSAPNYVTARSNGEGQLRLSYSKKGGTRPWFEVLTITQAGGYLRPGDQITMVLGDMSHGSPGMLAQTFVEGAREFQVLADVQATGQFIEVAGPQLFVPIVPGPPMHWKAVLPTLRRPGEEFSLGLKNEDKWGNPTQRASGAKLRLETSIPVIGLPEALEFRPDDRALTLEGLQVAQEGELRLKIYEAETLVAEAGPLIIREGDLAGFWGDLHGQTGETVGTNTAEHYFDFARNKAFLDVTSHQANDFQINAAFWDRLNTLTAEWNEPGRFTVLPGYEWSGNTAVGGDHNVYFREEGRTIRRCSHALLEDRSEMDNDAHTLTDLYAAFRDTGEDVVMYAHVGGRYANIHFDHDPNIETAVEVHSAWGTFEWILTDGFDLGRRVGVVCNSDGHKGRPGASYPGDSLFGAYGGLTCFLTPNNTRDSILEAQRRRHHYGTTGCRMFMDVNVTLDQDSTLYERNPEGAPDCQYETVRNAVMGDVVQTNCKSARLSLEVRAHSGIERIEVRRGKEVFKTFRPYTEGELGNRIRVLWSGAEYRGRGRNTTWNGLARFSDTAISRLEKINQWNPDALFEQRGSRQVLWKTVTTGNYMGFDAWVEDLKGTLDIATNLGELSVPIAETGLEQKSVDCGGLERQIKLFRLPDAALKRSLTADIDIPLYETGDTPLWISVYTEDGFQAWSSPVYLFH